MVRLRTNQRELNGHTCMLKKIFKIGRGWDHESRVRETMLGEALEVCPVHLLYKDHKGWTRDKGGVPPTRHMAGGYRGMNLHISEIISDILEPMVGRVTEGCEVISTENALATFEEKNEAMVGWTSTSWWEDKTVENFVACGKCASLDSYEWNEDKPDVCRCEDRHMDDIDDNKLKVDEEICQNMGTLALYDKESRITEGVKFKESTVGMNYKESTMGGNGNCSTVDGRTRCTHTFVQTLRRLRWEQSVEWDEDYDRILDSREVLEEDLQDYSIPMVMIGADVISLYPNLDVDKVVVRIEEEVKRTDMVFSNVDYLEATCYLALNWSHSQCRSSSLRRVLPWRRSSRGTRPGITGQGPRNKVRGEQEQWEFPRVILEEWGKAEIIASVIRIATEAMFKKHFYSFSYKFQINKMQGYLINTSKMIFFFSKLGFTVRSFF